MPIMELLAGIQAYPKAHQVVRQHKLWPWIAIPGIMSFVYLGLMITAGIIFLPGVSSTVNQNWIPSWMSGEVTFYLVAVLLWLLLLVVGYVSYQQVVLALFSPVLGFLSETVELRLTGRPAPEFAWRQIIRDILRGLAINIRNLGWMLLFTALAWLISIVPLIGAMVSPALIILIQAYYSGFGLMDYTLERKRYSVVGSISFVKQHRARVLGVGLGFALLLLVPLVGWFFAPGYGAVAATIAALEKLAEPES